VKIQEMSVPLASELGGQAEKGAAGGQSKYSMDVRIMAEKGNIFPLR
jgi:hypothetical protein